MIKAIFKIIVFVVFSWLSIHALAVFGIFVVVGYLAYWLLFARRTVCLMCRLKKEGDWCPFCRRPVEKNKLYPQTITSVILNSCLILLISLASAGVVFVESLALYGLRFPITPKTVAFTIPAKNQYRLGEIFPLKIEVSGIKTPINVIQADIKFEPEHLKIVDISTEGSFANIFIQKEINNEKGYARLTGGVPNPGYNSPSGFFGTVYFQTQSPGVSVVEYLSSSMVLANDGQGSDVLKGLTPISYLILPEAVSPQEAASQKDNLSDRSVLGISESDTQMKFYNDGEVLKAETFLPAKATPVTLLSRIGSILKQVDYYILLWWDRIV